VVVGDGIDRVLLKYSDNYEKNARAFQPVMISRRAIAERKVRGALFNLINIGSVE
jgi:hypothetical protein